MSIKQNVAIVLWKNWTNMYHFENDQKRVIIFANPLQLMLFCVKDIFCTANNYPP